MNRINWIDWAKALGILLVVMGHSQYSNENIVHMIFMIHMPLFFFISGYLYNKKGIKELHISNWNSLLLPYLAYNLAFALFIVFSRVIKLLLGEEVDWIYSFVNPLYHTVFGIANGIFDGPTWFLLALVWCKYISYLLHKSDKKYIKIIIVFLSVVLFVIRQFSDTQFPLAIDCALVGFIWFELGHLIKAMQIKFSFYAWFIFAPIGFWSCYKIFLFNGQCNYMIADVKGFLGLLGTGMGIAAFFSVCKILGKYNSCVIVHISQASIVIMCLHMMIQAPMETITHYQNGLLTTFTGDLLIVLTLTAIYPLLKKYIPALTGRRK